VTQEDSGTAPARSARDPRVVRAVRLLRDRDWRHAERAVALDGDELIAAALDHGLRPEWVLEDAAHAHEPAPWRDRVDPARVAFASEDALRAMAALGQAPRAVAVVPLAPAVPPYPVPPGALVLHGLSDEGNVGSIIRTAAALEAPRVVLGGHTADPFARRALRAAAGATFAPGLVAGGGRPVRLAELRGSVPLAAAVPRGGVAPERLPRDAAIVLGSERDGLSPADAAACDLAVTIPAPGFESLNVAAAAAILLYVLRAAPRRRP
jgi:RNA methyltransferase, TrmH family